MNYDTLQIPHIEGFESPKKVQNNDNDHTPSTLPFSFQNQKYSTPPSTPNKPTSSRGSDSNFTPRIKKTKRRDCTPMSPDDKEVSDFASISGAYSLLQPKKEKLNFMEKIEQCENSVVNDFESKLKGAILLSQIDSNNNDVNIMKVILQDNELLLNLSNEIIGNFINGFNTKNQIFYNLLTNSTILEIVGFPLQDMNTTLRTLNDNIISFNANYSSVQIDPDWSNFFFYLTIGGEAMLKSVNSEIVKFILSFKVNINKDKKAYFHDFQLKNVVCVDYIKIKIN